MCDRKHVLEYEVCEYVVCLCTRIRGGGGGGEIERERQRNALGEGRDINHAKSNLAPREFIRI